MVRSGSVGVAIETMSLNFNKFRRLFKVFSVVCQDSPVLVAELDVPLS